MGIFDNFMIGQLNYATAALLLRLIVAACLLPFGIKKVAEWQERKNNFFSVFGLPKSTSYFLAAFAEICAPTMLVFGFFTRIAALGGILNMGVAYYMDIKVIKNNNPYYYATAFPILICYIAVFIIGPGTYSLDYFLF